LADKNIGWLEARQIYVAGFLDRGTPVAGLSRHFVVSDDTRGSGAAEAAWKF
jgi:hypothetical protein